MTKDQLQHLFLKYLGRECSEKEFNIHGRKPYSYFEIEIQNCEERELFLYNKINEKNLKIKIAVASNINFFKKSLGIVLPSLIDCGIKKEDIHVFIGGFNEYKFDNKKEISYHCLNHNSYEYSPLIEICEKELQADYWFLIHDTCKVGPLFKQKLYSIPNTLPDKIALKSTPSMSIGLYKYNYLLKHKKKLLKIKNVDYSEESMIKWKFWGVDNEDYLLFKTSPQPHIYFSSRDEVVDWDDNNWFNSKTKRKTEYFPSLDLFKNKANWGQTSVGQGEHMVRVL
jgi:hypothetical protein